MKRGFNTIGLLLISTDMIENYKTSKELVAVFLKKLEERTKLNNIKKWKPQHKHEPRL